MWHSQDTTIIDSEVIALYGKKQITTTNTTEKKETESSVSFPSQKTHAWNLNLSSLYNSWANSHTSELVQSTWSVENIHKFTTKPENVLTY